MTSPHAADFDRIELEEGLAHLDTLAEPALDFMDEECEGAAVLDLICATLAAVGFLLGIGGAAAVIWGLVS